MAMKLIITDAGKNALKNAQRDGTTALRITSIALGNGRYTPLKSHTALEQEHHRLNTIAGSVAGPNTLHITVRDESKEEYGAFELGLITDKGILFAIYSQQKIIIEKASSSTLLLSIDIELTDVNTDNISFGNTNFVNPPATQETRGVISLTTEDEAKRGSDDAKAITAKTLKTTLDWRLRTAENLGTAAQKNVEDFDSAGSANNAWQHAENAMRHRGRVSFTQDWSIINKTGIYTVVPGDGGRNDSTPDTNYFYGVLTVHNDDDNITRQEYTSHQGRIHVRMKWGGNDFSPWADIWGTHNINEMKNAIGIYGKNAAYDSPGLLSLSHWDIQDVSGIESKAASEKHAKQAWLHAESGHRFRRWISPTENWDKITQTGIYVVSENTGLRGIGAPPADYWWGMLIVDSDNYEMVTQTYFSHVGGRVFTRMRWGGKENNYQPWNEYLNSNSLAQKTYYLEAYDTLYVPSDTTLHSAEATVLVVPESGIYFLSGVIGAWGGGWNNSDIAHFWAAGFLRNGQHLTAETGAHNSVVGNHHASVPINGKFYLNKGDRITAGFYHHQGKPWDAVHLNSTLTLVKIGN